jgi:hypothetical protein
MEKIRPADRVARRPLRIAVKKRICEQRAKLRDNE